MLGVAVLMIATAALSAAAAADHNCGGTLTHDKGIIATPNFPHPFSVPARCRWLIDSSGLDHDAVIVVYLTQMYVSAGLVFTEYDYYDVWDATLQRNPRVVLRLTEENFIQSRWLLTHTRFFLIELELDRLEGNHLRVLDDLLDVYGFNITYEMTPYVEDPVRNDSCSVLACSLAGHCYISQDFNEFWCWCFSGFTGPYCNLGPLCSETNSPCRNGAICRQAGKYPTCVCPPNYTGALCEVRLVDSECTDDEDETVSCTTQCKFDGKEENICNCDTNLAIPVEKDRWRFVLHVKLTNLSALIVQHPGRTLYNHLEKQIQRFFRPVTLNRFEDLQIINITESGEVYFQFFSSGHDIGKVREAGGRLMERGRLGELAVATSEFTILHEQGLHLENVISNRKDTVRERDQVILSCIAQGSEQMSFTWYKDGFSIDVSKSAGNLWTSLLPKNSRDEYTALLGIEAVSTVDQGRYTCHVTDWGVQECKSLYLEVIGAPLLQVSPKAISLNKGEGVDLKCVSPSDHVGYSWTRDKQLFKLGAEEVWEDLKPWGSILRVRSLQKSATYTCQAHTSAATREQSVRVEVLTSLSCPRDLLNDILWELTASGATAITECPSGYTGAARRQCLTTKPGEAEWQRPDFSGCVSHVLDFITTDLRLLSRGYLKTSLWTTLDTLHDWLGVRSQLYPGDCEPVVDFLSQVLDHINRTNSWQELLNTTKVFYGCVSRLLASHQALLHDQKVQEVQMVVDHWSLLWSQHQNGTIGHLSYDELVIDTIKIQDESHTQYSYYIPLLSTTPSYPSWYTAKIAVQVAAQRATDDNIQHSIMTIVNYRNISQFLPKRSSQILRDGSEITFEIQSTVLSLSSIGRLKMRLELELTSMSPSSSELVSPSLHDWNLTCGFAPSLSSRAWSFGACSLLGVKRYPGQQSTVTRCLCHSPGVITVLITRHSAAEKVDWVEPGDASSVLALGCGCCLIELALSAVLLMVRWWSHRTSIQLLKIQSCLSASALMAIFIYLSKAPPHKSLYTPFNLVIQILFLLGICSHLGKLLVVYTEVVFIPNVKSIKYTVFGITTGVSVLIWLISLVAQSLATLQLLSWWAPAPSPVFYISVVSGALIVALFLFLFFNLFRRLRYLRCMKDSKSNRIINRRIGLLKRTVVLFTSIISVAVSSILYVNSPNKINIYIFSTLSALFGFFTFLCYIVHCETTFNVKLIKQMKLNPGKDQEYSSDSDYNLFNFFTKQEGEVESESGPPCLKGVPQSIMMTELTNKQQPTKPKMVTFNGDPPLYEKQVSNVDLEVYPNSPKKYKSPTVTEECSPLATLDIVPSIEIPEPKSETRQEEYQIGIPTEQLSERADICPEEPQPPKTDELTTSEKSPADVLDRISHDLEYLLSRPTTPKVATYQRHKTRPNIDPSSSSSTYITKTNL